MRRQLPPSKLMKKPMKRCTGQPNVTSQWCTFAATVSFWFHLPAEVQINFTKRNDSSIHCKIKRNPSLQLNIIHQTDLLFWYLNHHLTKHCTGAIFLRRFRLYVLSFMFRFMFANICFEKNENSEIYVMFIINITWNETWNNLV